MIDICLLKQINTGVCVCVCVCVVVCQLNMYINLSTYDQTNIK